MNKLMLAATLAVACAFAAVSMPALAQSSTDSSPSKPATATSTAHATAPAKRAVPAPGSRNCIRATGSLLPPAKGGCLPVAGRSYSQQDLQRTGAPNTARALQMLDPSIRVGGGH